MDLNIKDKLFIVGGAGSGFGKAVSIQLMNEGAQVIGIARKEEPLEAIQKNFPKNFSFVSGDIRDDEVQQIIYDLVVEEPLSGILVNAGGPPASRVLETSMQQWDEAYETVLRWKVAFVNKFMSKLLKQKYGRVVFVESQAVKQPVENLVLSNSLRMAVVGFVKTLTQETAKSGVTLNILAPGFHLTPAAQRVIDKKSETENISVDEAQKRIEANLTSIKMGDTNRFAELAAWLLSPSSEYINGQTISVDGGAVKGVFG